MWLLLAKLIFVFFAFDSKADFIDKVRENYGKKNTYSITIPSISKDEKKDKAIKKQKTNDSKQ